MVTFYALSVQFSVLVSCHVIVNQEIGFTKGSKSGTESYPSDSSWHITCLEPLLSCQIMLFQVLGLCGYRYLRLRSNCN